MGRSFLRHYLKQNARRARQRSVVEGDRDDVAEVQFSGEAKVLRLDRAARFQRAANALCAKSIDFQKPLPVIELQFTRRTGDGLLAVIDQRLKVFHLR